MPTQPASDAPVGKAMARWNALNDRQQLYLATIYDFDQAAEREANAEAAASWQRMRGGKPPPASEWRKITFDLKVPKSSKDGMGYTRLQHALRDAGVHDPGAGSTLARLEKDGLIVVTYDREEVRPFGWVDRVRVELTTRGRASVRAGKNITTPASKPRGLMSEWLWSVMARLYTVGDKGLSMDVTLNRDDEAPRWDLIRPLTQRRDGDYLDQYTVVTTAEGINPVTGYPYSSHTAYRVRLSPRGRWHYEIHHACYQEFYPEVDAPAPEERPGHAHSGLAEHTARTPKHLVDEAGWRLLVDLVEREARDMRFARNVNQDEVPDEVKALPPGVMSHEIKDVTGTEKSVERLRTRPSGPLVDVLDVQNWGRRRQHEPEGWQLVVLTDAGRAHYKQHVGEYQRAYPDVPIPPVWATIMDEQKQRWR